jgi:hypothetical protein
MGQRQGRWYQASALAGGGAQTHDDTRIPQENGHITPTGENPIAMIARRPEM